MLQQIASQQLLLMYLKNYKGDLKMKVFVSGSKNVSSFDNEILKVLNRIVENNHEILEKLFPNKSSFEKHV